MAQIIDISSKITNELPCVKISDDIVVTVNNRKSTILNIQAMVQEAERKHKEAAKNGSSTDDADSEVKMMTKTLGMLVGQKNAEAIEKLDLPIPEYKEVFQTIMGVAQGNYGTPKE